LTNHVVHFLISSRIYHLHEPYIVDRDEPSKGQECYDLLT